MSVYFTFIDHVSQTYYPNKENVRIINTHLVAASEALCLSFFSRKHSPHQLENSFWYFFISLKTELYTDYEIWVYEKPVESSFKPYIHIQSNKKVGTIKDFRHNTPYTESVNTSSFPVPKNLKIE